MNKRYYIKTFGCQMNIRDSENIATLLENNGYELTSTTASADVIILNTCSIREKAEQKVYSQLGRLKEYKKDNPRLIIGVGGCLAQQCGKKFFHKAPHIDIIFGTRSIHRIPELIRYAESSDSPVVDIERDEYNDLPEILTKPKPGKVNSYVTIMQGCNNYCSYCVVPYLRGPERSRDPVHIISEVKHLAALGIKEITLLGQNVNSYGTSMDKAITFPDLLKKIAAIEGIDRIRFTTSHPKDLSPELIGCFAEIEKLCNHIHLPVQSGSDAILKRMNRGYSVKEYIKKVEVLRDTCPEISITSDLIVGFPGETDNDFQETIDLMEKIRFDNVFSFKYSEREGTAAAQYPLKVSNHEKDSRLQTLQKLQEKHTLEKNKKYVSKIVRVLVEGKSKNSPEEVMGRTGSNRITNFTGKCQLVGNTVPVLITKAYLHSLHGELHIEGDQ